MRAIVLVDHGSRSETANRVVEEVAAQLRATHGAHVEIAHLEICPPTIADAIEACVADGATEISVVPYFLGPGRHANEDVPRHVHEAIARHDGIQVQIAEPFGAHPLLVALVAERAGL